MYVHSYTYVHTSFITLVLTTFFVFLITIATMTYKKVVILHQLLGMLILSHITTTGIYKHTFKINNTVQN